MPRPKLLVFDLDGTLIDSRLDLAHSVNNILASLGKDRLPVETVISYVGDGAQDLLRRSLQAAGFTQVEAQAAMPAAFPTFIEDYGRNCLNYTLPYFGVLDLLERFPGCRKAVLTNKPLAPALKILEGLVLKDYFDMIVGGDGPHGKKPDPAGFRYILSTLGALPGEAMMIGDGMQDLGVARAVGCPFTAFLGGMGDPGALAEGGPDYAVRDYGELKTLLMGMDRGTRN